MSGIYKKKRPHGEGVGPRLLTLAESQKETPPGGGVGPEMRSPAGHIRKRPLCGGVGPEMRSPAGFTKQIVEALPDLVKVCPRPASEGGSP